jgi:hypothetical protein
MNTFKNILIALIFSTVGVAFTSNAALITDWEFVVDSAFTGSTYQEIPGDGDFEELLLHASGDPTKLRWGDEEEASDRSYIDISADGVTGQTANGKVEGMVYTDGASVQTSKLVHYNWPIPLASKLLETAELTTNLSLEHDGGIEFLPTIVFDILFEETPNGSPCVVPVNPTYGPCDDIFIIGLSVDSGEAIIDPLTGDFIQFFSVDEFTYKVTIAVDGVFPIFDPVICAAAGGGSPCVGLTTHERNTNGFDVMMNVSLVPEPSSILLMSFALFGIVGSMRKKNV